MRTLGSSRRSTKRLVFSDTDEKYTRSGDSEALRAVNLMSVFVAKEEPSILDVVIIFALNTTSSIFCLA